MSDELITTPNNGTVSPEITAPEPVAVAAADTTPVVEPPRDYESELAYKDQQLTEMATKMNAIQGSSKKAQTEREEMMVEMARVMNQRDAIIREKDDALEKKSADLAEVSQATQTLNQKTQDLEGKLSELEQALQNERAKNVKLDIITQEFPHLLRYAEYIPSSVDAGEVRGYCIKFQSAREADLSDYRQIVAGGQMVRTVPTGQPAVRPDYTGDATRLEERFQSLDPLKDRALYEQELKAAILNFGSQRQN